MKTLKTATTAINVVPTNNVVEISDEGRKILEEVEYTSKGVSVDVMCHKARFLNRITNSPDGKKNNTYSIALLNNGDKKYLRDHCFKYYLDYTNSSYQKHYFCKTLGYKDAVYNLKVLVDKFEMYLENKFKEVGLISPEGLITDQKLYSSWYNRCRLYLHEKSFAKQMSEGKILPINDRQLRRKDAGFVESMKKQNPVTIESKKHTRLTTQMIQKVYEDALGFKVTDDMFEYTIA